MWSILTNTHWHVKGVTDGQPIIPYKSFTAEDELPHFIYMLN